MRAEMIEKIYTPFLCDVDILSQLKRDAEQTRRTVAQNIREILLKHYKDRIRENTQKKGGEAMRLVVKKEMLFTEQFIEYYISSLDIKPKSKETYKKGIKNFTAWLNTCGIASPTRADILDYKAALLQKYAACTVSSYLTAVKSFYTFLEGEKWYPNMAAGVKGAKHQKGFWKDALTAKQTKKILGSVDTATIEGKRNYALVNLLVRTGLRTVEAERANVEDIRSEAGEALLYIQGKGRDSKDAFVILTENTLRPVQEYLNERGKASETAPLFASISDRNHGGRLTVHSISRVVKQTLRASGHDTNRLTAHSMRHTAITLALLGGATVQEAQALARHQNINSTLIYAHNLSRIACAPERKIDALLAADHLALEDHFKGGIKGTPKAFSKN